MPRSYARRCGPAWIRDNIVTPGPDVGRLVSRCEYDTQYEKRQTNNYFLFRRVRLWRDSLRIYGEARSDASLSLPGLPAIQRRPVFFLRHRAGESVQALARFATLS